MNWIQDAGHGGKDSGALANGNVEKNYTLEAALYVDQRLKEHEIESTCSRTEDVTLDETPRVNVVKKHKKCISHHFNAGGGSGVECIVSQYANQKIANLIVEEFKNSGYPVRKTPVFTRKLPNGQDYYYMHRRTGNCEVIIVEYDFVDGPQHEKIKDKTYREGMYEAVVRAICRSEGVGYKAPAKEQVVEIIEKKDENELSSWAKAPWDKAVLKGIFDGTKPQSPLTREQAAVVLDRLGLLNQNNLR